MKQDGVSAQQECVKRAAQPKGEPGPGGLMKDGQRRARCTLLCPRGVTDVRRYVWVVKSLRQIPVEAQRRCPPPVHPYIYSRPGWTRG